MLVAGLFQLGVGLPVVELADGLEAFLQLLGRRGGGYKFGAGLAIQRNHRSVAVQTRTRLLSLLGALGAFLVREHVGVAAPIAVVDGKGVAREHAREPGILLRLFGRQHAFRG